MNEEKTPTESNVAEAPEGSDVTLSAAEFESLKKLASERAQYLDLLQRKQAEFENYQKRNQKDRDQERKYILGGLILELLPVFDNLDRAISSVQQTGEKSGLVDGVLLVQNQFLELLKRHGIVKIDALGKPFDPNQHQAVMQRPAADVEPNTVIQVLEQGFMIHDRVLRPAKVIVSVKG